MQIINKIIIFDISIYISKSTFSSTRHNNIVNNNCHRETKYYILLYPIFEYILYIFINA